MDFMLLDFYHIGLSATEQFTIQPNDQRMCAKFIKLNAKENTHTYIQEQ